MGDQSKELTIEEIQLWWEINDSDIVTVPETRECDTTDSIGIYIYKQLKYNLPYT